MQISGAEWKQFIGDDLFWNARWLEEWQLEIDGKTYSSETSDIDLCQVPDNAKIKIMYGFILDDKNPSTLDLKRFFQKWEKTQTTVRLVIEAPKDKLNAIKKAVKFAGGKVL